MSLCVHADDGGHGLREALWGPGWHTRVLCSWLESQTFEGYRVHVEAVCELYRASAKGGSVLPAQQGLGRVRSRLLFVGALAPL